MVLDAAGPAERSSRRPNHKNGSGERQMGYPGRARSQRSGWRDYRPCGARVKKFRGVRWSGWVTPYWLRFFAALRMTELDGCTMAHHEFISNRGGSSLYS